MEGEIEGDVYKGGKIVSTGSEGEGGVRSDLQGRACAVSIC